MELGELIKMLEAADQDHVLPLGFNDPHSYRGYYDELAFTPAENITVADVLTAARSALGATYIGWRGGDFTMTEDTDCWLADYGESGGETIGPVLMRLMLAAGRAHTRTVWGVRVTYPDGQVVVYNALDPESAARDADASQYPAEVVSRTVTTTEWEAVDG